MTNNIDKSFPIENWFAELYKLSVDGKLSINQLYSEFLKRISRIPNNPIGKPRPYFYSYEWPWVKELEGCYYRAEEVDIVLKDMESMAKTLEKIETWADKREIYASEITMDEDDLGFLYMYIHEALKNYREKYGNGFKNIAVDTEPTLEWEPK